MVLSRLLTFSNYRFPSSGEGRTQQRACVFDIDIAPAPLGWNVKRAPCDDNYRKHETNRFIKLGCTFWPPCVALLRIYIPRNESTSSVSMFITKRTVR